MHLLNLNNMHNIVSKLKPNIYFQTQMDLQFESIRMSDFIPS